MDITVDNSTYNTSSYSSCTACSGIHSIHQYKSKQVKICPPVTVQSKNIKAHQSHSQGIPQRVPKLKRRISAKVPQSEPSQRMKRPRHGMTFVSINGSEYYFGDVPLWVQSHSSHSHRTPIDGMTDIIIFNAYKKNFDMLEKKGFKVKLNIMDNQATKHTQKFLTEHECKLQLVD